MFKGKKTCEVLRAVRKRVADLNGIQYVPVECTHEGDCIGTCPACERERQYVEEQLSLRAMAGHTLKVVGVAAGLTSMLSGQEVQAQEMMQERDTVQKRFEWDYYGFDFDGREPKPEEMAQWDEMATFVSKFPADTFLVVGHTEERASEKYRLRLSEEKARYLRALLVNRGVDPQRIKTIGAGSTECVIPNAQTEAEHEHNRRVTLEFYTLEREKEIREETVILPKFEWNSYCFDFGCGPKLEDMVQWDEMATFISKFPEDTFLVVGHTEERASEKYRLRLSEEKARYLRALLVNRGVDPQRIKTIGAGSTECVIPNAQTEAEHEHNRRVTLEFYTLEREKEIREETVILPKFEWNSYCFDFGCGPKLEDMVQWDEMATFISKFPEDTFLVVGHTDERGSKAYNLKVSEARAKFLHKLLVERGVDSLRIKSIGAGPTECVKPNAQTEAEHEQNRRVTLEFYTPGRVEAIKRKIEPSASLEGVKPIKGKYERKKFIRKKRRR